MTYIDKKSLKHFAVGGTYFFDALGCAVGCGGGIL